jgi:lipopolysaccharide transport system permease protein
MSLPERLASDPQRSGENSPVPRVTVIQPRTGWAPLHLRELWASRRLLYVLTWRLVTVRYKQTVLGAAWAVLQPFLTMVVFSIFFGRLARLPSDGVPYPVFAYCALVPWTYFATALTQAANSMVDHRSLLTKVYFPRILVPTAAVVAGLVDFSIAFVVLLGMLLFYGIAPSLAVLALPLFVLLAGVTALGAGLWLAALNVQYRDVHFTIPFLTQFWLFATPVAYSSSLVPERWRAVLGLNPMAGVVEGFRWALLGKEAPGLLMLVSVVAVLLLLTGGLFYFRRMERFYADIV